VGPPHAEKHALNPWQHKQWVISPPAHADVVGAMEEVVEVDTRPDAPRRPQVCVAATSQQLGAETPGPIPALPGQPAGLDDAYERKGTAHLFLVFEPLAGHRWVQVTARRTAVAFAQVIQAWLDGHDPQAKQLVLVMDHLNTHQLASLSKTLAPAEARRRLERLERHDTPKHGSWFKMAETARRVLATPCVDRRLPDPITLTQEVAAWERQRHTAQGRVEWRGTTPDARLKLKRLDPSIQLG
jgi:DDE superfamily endonuclease